MLECFRARKKDLAEQLATLAKETATDVDRREEIDGRAWGLVGRLELYRPTGPLEFFDHLQGARNYLETLLVEFGEPSDDQEAEYLKEVTHALELVKDVSDLRF